MFLFWPRQSPAGLVLLLAVALPPTKMLSHGHLVTSKYRTDTEIVHLLEGFRWNRYWRSEQSSPRTNNPPKPRKPTPPVAPPVCPHCGSVRFTPTRRPGRHLNKHFSRHTYHCNYCNSSYCVTAQTAFHGTRISLRKWFYIIELSTYTPVPSIVEIARIARVAKNTAHRALTAIRSNDKLMLQTVEFVKQQLYSPT